MVKLHQLGGAWGTSSVSPFCMKVEAYLRMRGLPFEVLPADPRRAPRGKIPYAEVDGELVADSQNVLDRLEARADAPLDAHLTEPERALGHALRRMLEEATYFHLVHLRWVEPAGWAAYLPVLKTFAPPVVGGPVLWAIRRGLVRALRAQGTGRRPAEEIHRLAIEDFRALSVAIRGPLLFGERPTTFDATAFAFVSACAAFPVPSPPRDFVATEPKLVALRRHVLERWFDGGEAPAR